MPQFMPGQIVFGRNIKSNTPFIDDWGSIRFCKKNLIDKNNQVENKNRKTAHAYNTV